MPIYEYRCENGHQFEVVQSMSDDPVTACEECGAPVERVFHPIAIHFKGTGFHNTDYKKTGKAGAKDGDSSSSDSDSGSSDSNKSNSSKSDSSTSDSKKSDSGSAAKTEASD